MKKVLFLTALAGLVTFTACQKPDAPDANNDDAAAQHVILIPNIGEKAGYEMAGQNTPGTRAIKTAWEAGDNLYLYLKPASVTKSKDLIGAILTYNGSKWEITDGQTNLDAVTESGTYCLAYVAGTKRTPTLEDEDNPMYERYSLGRVNDANSDGAYGEVQTDWNKDYTYSSGTITLTPSTFYAETFQLVITNLDKKSIPVQLITPGDTPYAKLIGIKEVCAEISDGKVRFAKFINSGKLYGIPNADGIAYYGVSESGDEQHKLQLYVPSTSSTFQKVSTSTFNLELGKAYKTTGPVLNDTYTDIETDNGWTKI